MKKTQSKESKRIRKTDTTVFPLEFIRMLNSKEKKAKLISLDVNEEDFFK
ncbi:hypothetical protein SRABI111_00287 [Pseudomonas carnis]|nr:hypothetical protein SRABI111_00287 [Pseudomonas carnis]CAH0136858.1 hypothetical protein SRABI110_00431 [Pseudomonas carnis]CAH0160289.1 hypothetical protein SRABI64_00761 [Pseudomonas carnis]CAH0199822.1 hypothetical protein SRABI08_01865 [Pseudomonas carnis]